MNLFFASTMKEMDLVQLRASALAELKLLAECSGAISVNYFEQFMQEGSERAIVSCLEKAVESDELWVMLGKFPGSPCVVPPRKRKLTGFVKKVQSHVAQRNPAIYKLLEHEGRSLPPICFVEAFIVSTLKRPRSITSFLLPIMVDKALRYASLSKNLNPDCDVEVVFQKLLAEFSQWQTILELNLTGSGGGGGTERKAVCRLIWLLETILFLQNENIQRYEPSEIHSVIRSRYPTFFSTLTQGTRVCQASEEAAHLSSLAKYSTGNIWVWKAEFSYFINEGRFDSLVKTLIPRYREIRFVICSRLSVNSELLSALRKCLASLPRNRRDDLLVFNGDSSAFQNLDNDLPPTSILGAGKERDYKIMVERLSERESIIFDDDQKRSLLTFGTNPRSILTMQSKLRKVFRSEFITLEKWINTQQAGLS